MNLAVTVLHNVKFNSFAGFDPESNDLRHSHTFQVVADSVNTAAELVWTLANVDDASQLPMHLSIYGAQVTEYRARLNRSLSVGDVLLMVDLDHDDQRVAGVMACQAVGWQGLEYVPVHEAGSNLDSTSGSYRAYAQNW